jgi:hypothetical protein
MNAREQARPPPMNARETSKTTLYERKKKKTNGPPTRLLKKYTIPSTRIPKEARKAIPQEHQRYQLVTIPMTTPTTTLTTTLVMTPTRTTPMRCLAQGVESAKKCFFCRYKIKKN